MTQLNYQMTLDELYSPSTTEFSENIISTVNDNQLSFDFNSLFIDEINGEEIHNNNSMAILGDSLEILKHIKSNSINLILQMHLITLERILGIIKINGAMLIYILNGAKNG